LFDLGSYPALLPGADRVLGEIWQFRAADMPETLCILDRIEGTDQPGEPNLYNRCIVPAIGFDQSVARPAYTYVWAHPEQLNQAFYIVPTIELAGARYASWPGG